MNLIIQIFIYVSFPTFVLAMSECLKWVHFCFLNPGNMLCLPTKKNIRIYFCFMKATLEAVFEQLCFCSPLFPNRKSTKKYFQIFITWLCNALQNILKASVSFHSLKKSVNKRLSDVKTKKKWEMKTERSHSKFLGYSKFMWKID